MYTIWMTQGQGDMCIAKFESKLDATEFLALKTAGKDGSYALDEEED